MAHVDPERVLLVLGRRVAELRATKRLTQEELAERAEVSVRYIQRVEAGTENLTVRTLAKLANALRSDLVALLSSPASVRKSPPGRPRTVR